jgi:polar amino acid transport system permease protein
LNYITDFVSYTITLMPQVIKGLMVTLQIFSLTLIFSIPLGILTSVGRLSKFKPLKTLTGIYISVMRGTPLLLQIIFIFFGLPLIGITLDRYPAALLAFVLNYGAYFAEIFRAGISSIDKGQYEASFVLGLSHKNTFFRIILPQALKRVLPPVGNEVITLVKDTSLVYVLGLSELLKIGKNASNRDASLVPLIIVGAVYLLLIIALSKVLSYIEHKYDYYH